jgi:hypothetical protein
MRSIAWQLRTPGHRPFVSTNGFEEPFDGTLQELVTSTKALTLLSRDGAEVTVAVQRRLGDDSWEGEVLRVATTDSGLRLGAIVSFEGSHIQGGIL